MCRRIRFSFVLFVTIVKLTTAGSAVGQLSRARRAVRQPAVATPRPVVAATAKADPEPEPAKAKPAATAPPAAPKPKPTRRTSAPRQQAVTPTPRPQSLGSLGRARQAVRPVVPQQAVVQPPPQAPSPTPRPRPKHPPHRRPVHTPLPPFRHRAPRFTAIAAAPCIHDTVIINEVAPPPVTVFEQPVLVAEPPVHSPPSLGETGPLVVEGDVIGQPDFLTPQYSPEPGFLSFPYEFGNHGIMTFGTQKQWSSSAVFEVGSNFDRLSRSGLGFLLEHESRFGIDVKWDSYTEDLGGGLTDELHLTDINVLFRVAESPDYLVRAGIGANILGDAFGTDGGFNATIKADFFPVQPLVLSAEVDLGTIGDAEMFHTAGKVGLMMDRFELFGGYDYRTIGGVPLQGAMIGLQVWF